MRSFKEQEGASDLRTRQILSQANDAIDSEEKRLSAVAVEALALAFKRRRRRNL